MRRQKICLKQDDRMDRQRGDRTRAITTIETKVKVVGEVRRVDSKVVNQVVNRVAVVKKVEQDVEGAGVATTGVEEVKLEAHHAVLHRSVHESLTRVFVASSK
jgi:hypothetical protein